MNQTYKIFSLIVGVSAIMVLTWGIVLGLFGLNFQLHEPMIPVAILEVSLGIIAMPYYFSLGNKILKEIK